MIRSRLTSQTHITVLRQQLKATIKLLEQHATTMQDMTNRVEQMQAELSQQQKLVDEAALSRPAFTEQGK